MHEIPPLFRHEGAIHISNQVTLNPRLQVSFEATRLLPIGNVASKESNQDKFKASLRLCASRRRRSYRDMQSTRICNVR